MFDKLRALTEQIAAAPPGTLDPRLVQQAVARVNFAIEVVEALGSPEGDAAVDVLMAEWEKVKPGHAS